MLHQTPQHPVRRKIAVNGNGAANRVAVVVRKDVRKQVGIALSLFRRGRRTDALGYFARLREQYPQHSTVWLESATALDRCGREAEAILLYERAIELGLEGGNSRDALICLASSLRSVGRVEEAVRCLERARKCYPRDVACKLFLGLCYHDLGRTTHALRLVALTCLQESTDRDLVAYKGALGRKYQSLGRTSKT